MWEVPLAHAGLGGIAATDRYVVFGDRDLDDFHDVFRCLDAEDGQTLWEVQRLAIAALDYGNTPRATPLIAGEHVYCLGAHGHLLCIRLADGHVVWEKYFRDEYPLREELPWGHCGSPLLVDGRLVVAPGATGASLIAIDRDTGEVEWRSPGQPPGYGSLTAGVFGGVKQVVGHDASSLGGWDIETGKRLWSLKPDAEGDFNVPTPIVHDGQLIIATENNGTRQLEFASGGRVVADPVARNDKLRPDMSTPVVVGDRLYCVNNFLYCLDVNNGLAESWRLRDRAIGDYAAIIASPDHMLVIGKGELLLLPTDGRRKILARGKVFDQRVNLYSHPALVGNRLYIRGPSALVCLRL